jgi:hypothetical protein
MIERNIKKNKKIVVNLFHTHYPVIKEVCEEVFNYTVVLNYKKS